MQGRIRRQMFGGAFPLERPAAGDPSARLAQSSESPSDCRVMPSPPAATPWIERIVASPAARACYGSLVVHVSLLLLLALSLLPPGTDAKPRLLTLAFGPPSADLSVDDFILAEAGPAIDVGSDAAIDASPHDATPALADSPLPDLAGDAAKMMALDEPPPAIGPPSTDSSDQISDISLPTQLVASRVDNLAPGRGGRPGGGGAAKMSTYASRRGRARQASARSRGGNAASEAAVDRGLAWLALHQAVDGSWQFDLSGCRCDGACRDPGTLASSTASTAIALLPFLGAGSTHLDGPYQETVSRAIYFLVSRMQPTPRGGDFCEGTMYGHGVTTLALAEALGMTKDEMLVPYVRDAVRFIETAQDLHGGGWRYLPGQPGDITVTAWQVAALKSAALAGIETPSPTLDGVSRFLDRVQTQRGAAYGYRTPAAKSCTSAIGLLCRMYTGWEPDHEPLQRGITNLAKAGPAPQAVYENFYLAQALIQSDHPVWPRWNARNREQLVAQQARIGHEAGSWFFADHDTAPGGRLAHTALAVLTLEVYYRLLPIYRQEAVEGGF